MKSVGRVLKFVPLIVAAVSLNFGNQTSGVASSGPKRLEVARASHLSTASPGGSGLSGSSKRLAQAVAKLAPEEIKGLDSDDEDRLLEKVHKAIANAQDDVDDFEQDLEKREDDLGDNLENTEQRRTAYAKLRELNKALRPLRELLSDIRSDAEVGQNPDSLLRRIASFAAGVQAVENGIDELDLLVKAAEEHEDKDDD